CHWECDVGALPTAPIVHERDDITGSHSRSTRASVSEKDNVTAPRIVPNVLSNGAASSGFASRESPYEKLITVSSETMDGSTLFESVPAGYCFSLKESEFTSNM